jgi:hypothetical protein
MKFSSVLLFTAAAGVVSASIIRTELDERMEQGMTRVTPSFSYKACGSPADVLHVSSLILNPNPPHE